MPKKNLPSQSPPSPSKKLTPEDTRGDQIRNQLVQHMQDLRVQATEEKLTEDEIPLEKLNAWALDVAISNKLGAINQLPWKGNVEARNHLQRVKRRIDALRISMQVLPMEAFQAIFTIEARENKEILVPLHTKLCETRDDLDLARALLPSNPTKTKQPKPQKRGVKANDRATWVTACACKIFEIITGRVPEKFDKHAKGKSKYDTPALHSLQTFFYILGIDAHAGHYLLKYWKERNKIYSKNSN